MVLKVRVMSDEELQRHEKHNADLDECCDKIRLCICLGICIFVFVSSYIVIAIIKYTMGIRISEEAEKLGTDKAEVGVIAYSIRD